MSPWETCILNGSRGHILFSVNGGWSWGSWVWESENCSHSMGWCGQPCQMHTSCWVCICGGWGRQELLHSWVKPPFELPNLVTWSVISATHLSPMTNGPLDLEYAFADCGLFSCLYWERFLFPLYWLGLSVVRGGVGWYIDFSTENDGKANNRPEWVTVIQRVKQQSSHCTIMTMGLIECDTCLWHRSLQVLNYWMEKYIATIYQLHFNTYMLHLFICILITYVHVIVFINWKIIWFKGFSFIFLLVF